MSKLNKILISLVIVLLVVLLGLVGWYFYKTGKLGIQAPYYAIYLNSGDLYFGRYHCFPRSYLSDVHFLRQNPQDTENPYTVSKFNDAFWGPENKMYLNDDSILWKVKIRKDSQLLQAI